jgi:hypothetical protein
MADPAGQAAGPASDTGGSASNQQSPNQRQQPATSAAKQTPKKARARKKNTNTWFQSVERDPEVPYVRHKWVKLDYSARPGPESDGDPDPALPARQKEAMEAFQTGPKIANARIMARCDSGVTPGPFILAYLDFESYPVLCSWTLHEGNPLANPISFISYPALLFGGCWRRPAPAIGLTPDNLTLRAAGPTAIFGACWSRSARKPTKIWAAAWPENQWVSIPTGPNRAGPAGRGCALGMDLPDLWSRSAPTATK